MLEVRDLSKEYPAPNGTVHALDCVSLDVKEGEFVAVQGPSGCGKTTLLLSLGGLLLPTAGHVSVAGRDPYALSPNQRARWRADTVGFVFQQFHLVPYLNVLDNVLAASLARPSQDARVRALDLIEEFGLTHRTRHVPAELSTGERQRVAMARALLNKPKILLTDEPTGNLDDANSRAVLDHLAQFAQHGGAVLLVTHDAQTAAHAHRTLHMQAGKLRDR